MAIAPPIGRNGIVNSVRRITGNVVPGWRAVDPETTFIAGYIATLNSQGKATVANDSSENVLGLFNCHKTLNFYVPVEAEEGSFTGVGSYIALEKAYVKESSERITNSDGSILYVRDTDYTMNYTNGLIVHTSTGSIGSNDTIIIDYRYKDPNVTGLDQTLSGFCSVIEGEGEIATLVYETNAAWRVNVDVRVSENGMPTIGGNGIKLGFVTKPPTAGNLELHFQMRLT